MAKWGTSAASTFKPYHIAGGELFEGLARHRTHVQSVDLDQVAGLKHRVLLGFAHGVGTGRSARRDPGTPVRGRSTSRPCRLGRVRMRPTLGTETGNSCRRREN